MGNLAVFKIGADARARTSAQLSPPFCPKQSQSGKSARSRYRKCHRLTVLLCSSARRLYSTFCWDACFFRVSVCQLPHAVSAWIRTKVTVLTLGSGKLGLEFTDLLPQLGTLSGSARLLGRLGLESSEVLLDVDEVEDDVEDSGEDEREEEGGSSEVHFDQLSAGGRFDED